jgi:hypothetical protein
MLHLFEGEPPQFSQIQDHSEGLKSYPAYSSMLCDYLIAYFDPKKKDYDAQAILNLSLFLVEYFNEILHML